MAEETTTTEAQPTSDATEKTTGAEVTGTGTDTAQPNQAQEKTFTQADLDRIVQNRLKSAVKAELKKLAGDDDGKPNVEDLQRQLSENQAKLRSYEARSQVENFLNDGRNKLNVKPENIRGILKLVVPELEYDENGQPTNLKEAVESARSEAPALFANTPQSINAANGRTGQLVGEGMNGLIRRGAGFGS